MGPDRASRRAKLRARYKIEQKEVDEVEQEGVERQDEEELELSDEDESEESRGWLSTTT